MVPVQKLAQEGVNAIVVGGIGMRPLMGFQQAGIAVYYDADQPQVRLPDGLATTLLDYVRERRERITAEESFRTAASGPISRTGETRE